MGIGLLGDIGRVLNIEGSKEVPFSLGIIALDDTWDEGPKGS